MDSKEESQGRHCLLSAREIVHGTEPLTRGYAVVANSIQIRFLEKDTEAVHSIADSN